MHFSYQNLNEKKGGATGSILRQGRAWLRLGKGERETVRAEWSVPTRFFHVGIEFGSPYEGTV